MATRGHVLKVHNINRKNLHQFCRCCLSSQNVSKNISELAHDSVMFVDIFSKLLLTSTKNIDNMPQTICEACLGEIIRFYKFKKNFDTIQEIFISILGKQIIKLPQNSTIANFNKSLKEVNDISHIKAVNKSVEQGLHKDIDNCEGSVIEKLSGDFEPSLKINTNCDNKKGHKVAVQQTFSKIDNETFKQAVKENTTNKSQTSIKYETVKELNESNLHYICVCSCQETFTSVALFSKHRRVARHFGPGSYKCKICNKSFSQTGIKNHHYSHFKEKVCECKTCNKKFASPATLERHMQLHERKSFVCEFCGKGFHRREYFVVHKATHTGENRYLCHHCGKGFISSKAYTKHLKLYEQQKICSRAKREKKFLCSRCGELFYYNFQIGSHDCNLDGNEVSQLCCVECPMKFSKAVNFNNHIEKLHGEGKCSNEIDDSKEMNFMCTVCKKFYSNQAFLDGHFLIHEVSEQSRIKNYACEICEKSFSTLCQLKSHVNVHAGYKPYACHICSKKYFRKYNLSVHLKTHTGERPYKCNVCDKTFSLKESLKAHLKIHVNKKLIYQCDKCSQKFSRVRSWYKHRKRLHTES